MKPGMQVGNTAEIVIEVSQAMCPTFDGVIVHRVYSTWSLAHHMELAARKVLVAHLEDDEEGIGTHLSIDHLAPTPVGRTVRIIAEVVEFDSTSVTCSLRAYHGRRLVARGRQIQRVLPKRKLKSLIERYTNEPRGSET